MYDQNNFKLLDENNIKATLIYILPDGKKDSLLDLNIKDNIIKLSNDKKEFMIAMNPDNKMEKFVFPTVEEVFDKKFSE